MRRRLATALAALLVAAGCAPQQEQVIKETVVVKETVIVRQTVVRVVTATPAPRSPTPRATQRPSATVASLPTRAPAATQGPRHGTYANPVMPGSEYAFPGLGSLKVKRCQWRPGQTGLAIVELSFRCERPAEQECDTGRFLLDALGRSGNGYKRKLDPAVPEPAFGWIGNPPVYGGGTEEGYAGFLITAAEESLLMRVRLFLEQGEVFFALG